MTYEAQVCRTFKNKVRTIEGRHHRTNLFTLNHDLSGAFTEFIKHVLWISWSTVHCKIKLVNYCNILFQNFSKKKSQNRGIGQTSNSEDIHGCRNLLHKLSYWALIVYELSLSLDQHLLVLLKKLRVAVVADFGEM